MFKRWQDKARALKREIYALYLALLDPRTPWYARVLAGVVVAYAVSPLDLIPDPIPVLGYLDDLILLPLGMMLVLRLVPPAVMEDARHRAATESRRSTFLPILGAIVIVVLWLATIALVTWGTWRYFV